MSVTRALSTSSSRPGRVVVLSRMPPALPDRVTAADGDICTVGTTVGTARDDRTGRPHGDERTLATRRASAILPASDRCESNSKA